MSKIIVINVTNPDVITPEYWERLEDKLVSLLKEYHIKGKLSNEVTSNSMTINKK